MKTTNMEQDRSTKPEYGFLSDADKIRAILGAVMEPVSKQLAIDLSQIDYDKLNDEAKAKVDAVFSEQDVESSKDGETDKFRLGDKGREKLATAVEMKSVYGTIADKILDDLGLDL
jgi:hypothetical protein